MELLDAALADRITLRQARALVEIAVADCGGIAFPLSALQTKYGSLPFRSIKRLKLLGLVDMEDSPDDRRNTLLSLTHRGRELSAALIKHLQN